MTDHSRKSRLFRKVNTQARGHCHHTGGNYRDDRPPAVDDGETPSQSSLGGRRRRGLDYTPLFRFLLSKVGHPWGEVYGEAKARLDRPGPVFWLVARNELERREMVRIGESTYFSGLYVDAQGILQRVNPNLRAEDLSPSCQCCTHTFNGFRFGHSSTSSGQSHA